MDFLFGGGAIWFTVPALAGTLFLVIELLLGQIGGDSPLETDFDAGIGDGAAPGHEFRLLSLQTISAFAMGGGWMGLGALKLLHWDFGWAALLGVAAGLGVAWVMVRLLRAVLRIQSSGNIALGDTVGHRGTVYVQVPPAGQGSGRVRVMIGTRVREYNAVQLGEGFLASHTSVKVVGVDGAANSVTVEPA